MIVLGLTGSIGMGKTTTAGMFADEGARVHDADAAVHRLYAKGGEAVAPVAAAFPGVVRAGAVDRAALAARIAGDPAALGRLEAIVHPLVARLRDDFIARARAEKAPVVVLDVPLLFEIGQQAGVDAVVVVTASPEVQRRRVLGRPGMTPERLVALMERQVPDAEKRTRADFLIDTGEGLDAARDQVRRILAEVRAPGWRAGRDLAGSAKPPH